MAIVHYPSRSAFVAMTSDPEFQEMAIHKEAGVEETTVLATTLRETPPLPAVEDPPYPATDDDHRGAALQNTYGLMTLPAVNTFNGVVSNAN